MSRQQKSSQASQRRGGGGGGQQQLSQAEILDQIMTNIVQVTASRASKDPAELQAGRTSWGRLLRIVAKISPRDFNRVMSSAFARIMASGILKPELFHREGTSQDSLELMILMMNLCVLLHTLVDFKQSRQSGSQGQIQIPDAYTYDAYRMHDDATDDRVLNFADLFTEEGDILLNIAHPDDLLHRIKAIISNYIKNIIAGSPHQAVQTGAMGGGGAASAGGHARSVTLTQQQQQEASSSGGAASKKKPTRNRKKEKRQAFKAKRAVIAQEVGQQVARDATQQVLQQMSKQAARQAMEEERRRRRFQQWGTTMTAADSIQDIQNDLTMLNIIWDVLENENMVKSIYTTQQTAAFTCPITLAAFIDPVSMSNTVTGGGAAGHPMPQVDLTLQRQTARRILADQQARVTSRRAQNPTDPDANYRHPVMRNLYYPDSFKMNRIPTGVKKVYLACERETIFNYLLQLMSGDPRVGRIIAQALQEHGQELDAEIRRRKGESGGGGRGGAA